MVSPATTSSSCGSYRASRLTRYVAARASMSRSIGGQQMTEAVVSPVAREAARNEGALQRGGSGELSTSPCVSGATPRNIEACAGTVSGGSIVRAEKHEAPESASEHRAGIERGVTNRGARPSIDTTSTRSDM